MKLKIGEVLTLNSELNQLMTEEGLSFTTKYHLSKGIAKTQDIVENFNKQRIDIIKEFGKVDETGKVSFSEEKDSKAATDAIEELLSEEEMIKFTGINLDDFKDLKSKYPYIVIYKFF